MKTLNLADSDGEYRNGNKCKILTQTENEFILEKTVKDFKNSGGVYF